MKWATEARHLIHGVRVPEAGKTLVTGKLPLFSWRKSTRNGDTEIVIGPSFAWAVVALLALLLKSLSGTTLLQMLWKLLIS